MAKRDYTAEMGEPARRMAIAVLVPATIVCAACFLIALAVAIVDFRGAPIGPLLGCILIFGGLAFATCWMAVRLIKRERAANARTTMPERFIQIFGIFFLIGLVFAAILDRNVWLLGEGVGVAFAMITIRSLIRREQIASSSNPGNTAEDPKRRITRR